MTSSSDTEFHRRRIYIEGLPPKSSSSEVKSIFAHCGTVSFVHLNRSGNGFVTFEDEDAALRALDLHGSKHDDFVLTVQPESEAAMPLPIVAVKRDIHFPKPSVSNRGPPQYKSSLNGCSHRNSSNFVPSSLSSFGQRSQRTGQRGQRLERRSSNPNVVKILQSPTIEETRNEETFCHGFPERYKMLFSFVNFPHVASKIFLMLDTVSLQRSRLVCKEWAFDIDHYILDSPVLKPKLLDNWKLSNCSIYSLNPENGDLAIEDNMEARYRNILSFKADEKEIMVAVDNGNIEIYDRFSMKLTCLLVGQYSASPVKIDFNDNLIFVQYTCAFANSRRRQTPSSWWNIYCRKSRKQLRSIDRDNAGPFVDVELQIDDMIYLTTNSNVFKIDALSTRLQMSKVLAMQDEDKIEAVEIEAQRSVIVFKRGDQLFLSLWMKSQPTGLFHCLNSFKIFSEDSDDIVDESKCQCMSLQVKNSLALTLLSNNRGSYEYLGGKPYVMLAFHDLKDQVCLRMLRLDSDWMSAMSDKLVPYDGESCLITAKFSQRHLAVGFGSFSDRKDGAIAIWSMDDILDRNKKDLEMWTIPAPTYHWGNWDGHIGGVNCLHIDNFGLVASNACQHQVTTRCIEREDESKKDNLLIYDFWSPGSDCRRPQGLIE